MRSLFSCSLRLLPAGVLAAAFAGACSDDAPAGRTEPSAEGGATRDAGLEIHDAGGVDAAPPPIRCTETELAANDKTDGGELEITWNTGANPAQYTNRCARVRVGANVTFSGSFVQHPLEPAGGDAPNPIPYTATDPPGGKLVVRFESPGTFGFRCEFHPTLMFGAIRVVP